MRCKSDLSYTVYLIWVRLARISNSEWVTARLQRRPKPRVVFKNQLALALKIGFLYYFWVYFHMLSFKISLFFNLILYNFLYSDTCLSYKNSLSHVILLARHFIIINVEQNLCTDDVASRFSFRWTLYLVSTKDSRFWGVKTVYVPAKIWTIDWPNVWIKDPKP